MSVVYVATWTEDQVLGYFWTMVNAGADRMALLKQLSPVVIQRPDDWDRADQRAAATPKGRADTCFSCLTGDRRLYWHHVLAIQHGGSTRYQNLVPICLKCHAHIHPWLDVSRPFEERRGVGGWTRIGEMLTRMTKEDGPLNDAAEETSAEPTAPRVPRV